MARFSPAPPIMAMYIHEMGRMLALPKGAAETGPTAGFSPARIGQGMAGQERGQMRRHPDRPHARTAAAVGDAEGLVQVQVAHVGADGAGAREAHLRVHVRPVHVDLAAVGVHDRADLPHVLLEHAVGRGIRDHERAEGRLVRFGLLAEIGEVHVAPVVAGHRHHAKARGDGARRVGAVGGDGNEAHVAVPLASARVIAADGQEPRVLPLGARVRLQGHGGEARDRGEPLLELREHRRRSPATARRERRGGARRRSARSREASRSWRSASSCRSPRGIIEVVSERSFACRRCR